MNDNYLILLVKALLQIQVWENCDLLYSYNMQATAKVADENM